MRSGGTSGPSRPPTTMIFSITVTGILTNTLIGPGIPDILDAFDRSDSAAGLFVAAGTFAGIFMAPVIGVLADRFGRRAVLIPCLVVFGVGGLLAGAAPSFWALIGFRFVQGVGGAGLINLAVVIISDHYDGLERARMIGRNAAVLTISLAVFPAVGGLLTELGGWRLPFALYAVALVTAVAAYRWLPPVDLGERQPLGHQLRAAGEVLRRPIVALAIAWGFVVFTLVFGVFLTALPIHLDDEFGLGPGPRGLVIAAPAASATVVALSVGRLRAAIGGRMIILVSTGLWAVAFTLIGLAPLLPLVLLAALLYGLGEGGSFPTLQDHVAGSAPAASRGAVVAVFVGAARAGQTVGPLLAAVGLALVGASGTFLVAGALTAAAFAVQALVRPSRVASPAR